MTTKVAGICRLGFCLLAMSFGARVYADAFCFLYADSYYEQIYCELQALAQDDQLPALFEFRHNDEMTQALLLKGPAQYAGIELVMPKRQAAAKPAPQPGIVSSPEVESIPEQLQAAVAAKPSVTVHSNAVVDNSGLSAGGGTSDSFGSFDTFGTCSLALGKVDCGTKSYRFASNKRNSALSDTLFAKENLLALHTFAGSVSDTAAVQLYLDYVYPLYLEKMIQLGLGEVTMTYQKFAAIFYDVTAKGVSFSERMETMYHYLKKDKQRMGVSISPVAPQSLTLAQCEWLPRELVRCVYGGRNYLFVGEG